MANLLTVILMVGQFLSFRGLKIGPRENEQDVAQAYRKPRIIRYVKPAFPNNSRFKNTTGTVVANVLVDTNGKVISIKFRDSLNPELREAVAAAIMGLLFEPGRDSTGNLIKVWYPLSVPISDMDNDVPSPGFPALADSMGLDSGEVVVDLKVGSDGSVLEAQVRKSSNWVFEAAALNAAMKARFAPSPNTQWFTIIYHFKKGETE